MKYYSIVVKLTCLLIVAVLLREYYLSISSFPKLEPEVSLYETFGISDWLINYQGGFVRRGLAGEVLWRLYQLHPYNVVYVIIGITSICLIALTILCIALFRRMGWPVWMLLFPMFLYYCSYGLGGQLGFRRDTLMLLLAFLLFGQYRKYVEGNWRSLFPIWFLSVLMILLHEGVIFSIFPFLILHTFVYNKSFISKVVKNLLLLWLPSAIALLAVVIFNGRDNSPEVIWQSWMPCFMAYPFGFSLPPIGLGPSWLSSSLREGNLFAMELTWKPEFIAGIPVWPFNIYLLIAIYYLFTRMEKLKVGKIKQIADHVQMSNVFLLQLLFTMPMLGVIGCDWYRSIPICCITSCFLCFLFPEHQNVPTIINRFSGWLQQKIDYSSYLSSSWVYYLVLVSLPLCYHCARPGGMFPFIPLDLKGNLLETVMEWI